MCRKSFLCTEFCLHIPNELWAFLQINSIIAGSWGKLASAHIVLLHLTKNIEILTNKCPSVYQWPIQAMISSETCWGRFPKSFLSLKLSSSMIPHQRYICNPRGCETDHYNLALQLHRMGSKLAHICHLNWFQKEIFRSFLQASDDQYPL